MSDMTTGVQKTAWSMLGLSQSMCEKMRVPQACCCPLLWSFCCFRACLDSRLEVRKGDLEAPGPGWALGPKPLLLPSFGQAQLGAAPSLSNEAYKRAPIRRT